MICYHIAGQVFHFPYLLPELDSLEMKVGAADEAAPFIPTTIPSAQSRTGETIGWVAGADRQVQTWSAPPGILMKVEGGSDFYIGQGGQVILCASRVQDDRTLSEIDRQILLGPVIVLALALRGTWSLHASAAMLREQVFAFVGESGQGKSTLAAYLAGRSGWRLVADDILPVAPGPEGLEAKPRFPQLKLPPEAQPGPHLAESLPLQRLCVLAEARPEEQPELELLPASQAAQVLVSHTAGTRLFEPKLLAEHLQFCAKAATQVQVYRLKYPRRREALPEIKELLEAIC
jgi:hypothetical protein